MSQQILSAFQTCRRAIKVAGDMNLAVPNLLQYLKQETDAAEAAYKAGDPHAMDKLKEVRTKLDEILREQGLKAEAASWAALEKVATTKTAASNDNSGQMKDWIAFQKSQGVTYSTREEAMQAFQKTLESAREKLKEPPPKKTAVTSEADFGPIWKEFLEWAEDREPNFRPATVRVFLQYNHKDVDWDQFYEWMQNHGSDPEFHSGDIELPTPESPFVPKTSARKTASSDEFTRAYIEAALFSTNDESDESGGEPLDKNYGPEDIAPESLSVMEQDCAKFQTDNADDIGSDLERAGHDFWLTRNGHGAGFWDGDWPEEVSDRLTEAAEAFGEVDLYVGDDGTIYQAGTENGAADQAAQDADDRRGDPYESPSSGPPNPSDDEFFNRKGSKTAAAPGGDRDLNAEGAALAAEIEQQFSQEEGYDKIASFVEQMKSEATQIDEFDFDAINQFVSEFEDGADLEARLDAWAGAPFHVTLDNESGRETGDVTVTSRDRLQAQKDGYIHGSTWETPDDMREAYTILLYDPNLDEKLRADGYIVDSSMFDDTLEYEFDQDRGEARLLDDDQAEAKRSGGQYQSKLPLDKE